MFDKRIELICEIMIKGLPLTKQTLFKSGFKEIEINELLEEGILQPAGLNEYKLYSLYELYYYGVDLLTSKEIKKANACFKRCHQLDPNNRHFILQLFIKSLKLQDYKMAIERFSSMEKIESEKYESENNLYLYLLSMVTSCEEQYAERLYSMDYDSIFPPIDSQENHKKEMNIIRHLIMKHKYRPALELLSKIIFREHFTTVEQEILRELLTQVIKAEMEFKLSLLEHAKNKNYQTIISLLKERANQRYLSNADTYIYLISQTISNILHTNLVPEVTITDTKCIYEAIKGNNFELARILNEEALIQKYPPLDNQIIHILLNDLNKLISKLKKEQIEQNTPNISIKDYMKETEEIAYYLQSENISLEEATIQMNLTREQVLIIKLIYARSYYTEEMYLLGDLLVKEVEKSKDKTSKVVKLLNETRTNKKFYKNRRNNYTKRLTPQQ